MSIEIVVARACPASEIGVLTKLYPAVSFVAAPPEATIPELRTLGMGHATGDVVALTDDHAIAGERWLEAMLGDAPQNGDAVGDGTGDACRGSVPDWASHFAAYGLRRRENTDNGADGREAGSHLNGNRGGSTHVVDEMVEWVRGGEWEDVNDGRLFSRESVLRFVNTAAAYDNRAASVREFCADRFAHGREYARRRLVEEAAVPRWMLLSATPFLPLVFAWRVGKRVGPGRRGRFVRALPATLVFFAAWALGEAAGYFGGPPTNAKP
jgi:hypothetical protein